MFNFKVSLASLVLIGATVGSVFAVCPDDVYFKRTQSALLGTPVTPDGYEDVDGDGRKDIIGLSTGYNPTAAAASIVVYKHSAAGFDTAPVLTPLSSPVRLVNMSFGDMNGDGKIDVLINDSLTGPASRTLYLGVGDGSFTASAVSTFDSITEEVVQITDLNGDGKGDLLIRNSSFGIAYRLTQSDLTSGALVTIGAGYRSTKAADFDNDGKTDILLWKDNSNTFKTMLNNGSAIFTPTSNMSTGGSNTPEIIADINNDGKLDIVTNIYGDPVQNGLYLFSTFLNNGSASFTKTNTTTDLTEQEFYTYYDSYRRIADLDGDGDKDLMYFGKTNYLVARNNGSGVFTVKKNSPPAFPGTLENVDGDGRADILAFRTSVLSPSLANSVVTYQNVCTPVGNTRFVDFNKDGQTDLAYWNPSDGRWVYKAGNTDVTFYWGLGSLGDVPVPQDYDGDGQTDYAVYRDSTGYWYIRRSSDGGYTIFAFGAPGDKPIAADYDGDGKADIAVYRPSTGVWYVWQSATESFYAATFGISEDIPLPMDYDGDNKADIAVFRPSTGVWYIQKSTGGFFITPFGFGTDKPIPADYDNDGIAEMAVFRNGNWYILRIKDGALFVRQYGSAGDIPIPLTKLTGLNFSVFRPSDGFVYDMGEPSTLMLGFNGNKIVSTILPN